MRALVDIDEGQVRELDRLAKKQKQSHAALIREAVADYLEKQGHGTTENAFGLWDRRKVDGLTHQEKIRNDGEGALRHQHPYRFSRCRPSGR